MTAAVYEPLDRAVLLPLIRNANGLVLFDVDCTVANGCFADMAEWEVRPGAVDTVQGLARLGIRVGFWSGGGQAHAHTTAVRMGVRDLLAGCWRKPPYPMTPYTVRALLGEMPALTLDDDAGEAVEGVTFCLVQPFLGCLASAEDLAVAAQQIASQSVDRTPHQNA